MMLVRILKLFGLDLPAKIAQVRVGIEERLELAKDQATQTAQTVAVLTALFALAAIALLSAFAVGLITLYSWVALSYGQFYGFAAVGCILTLIALVMFSAAVSKAKSRGGRRRRPGCRYKNQACPGACGTRRRGGSCN